MLKDTHGFNLMRTMSFKKIKIIEELKVFRYYQYPKNH